ncbi:MAG: hypothetical protein JXA50_10840 [Deltaproteobacteria bacterium]|nr:hypothetical protein [Deltaproteobacteria bacterium]
MKDKTITWGVVVALAVSLALSMPLWAAQSTKQKELDAEKVEKPKEKLEPLPHTTVRLPGPKINEFSCESLTDDYNILLFCGAPSDDYRVSIDFDIFARQGLSSFEILFRGHQVYHETFGGPIVSSRSGRDLKLDLSPHRPARSGTYTLQAKVVDRLGQAATRDLRLRCDMERPTIHSIRPADGETIYKDGGSVDITFEFDVSDDFSGISAVWMGGWYGSVTDTTPPFSITIRDIERDTGFDIQVLDGAGNVRSDYISVHVTPRPASLPGSARP